MKSDSAYRKPAPIKERVCCFQLPQAPPSDTNLVRASLSCSISAVETVYYKAIPVAVTLVCTASQPLTVDLGWSETGNLRFWLSSPDGVAVPQKLATPSLTFPGLVSVSPEHPYKVRLNLGSLEPPILPEQLEVRAALVAPSESTPLVVTNATTMTLLDSDKEVVEQHSLVLAHAIVTARTSDERSELASELAGIHDSDAIDAIKSVLGKGLGIDTPFLIDGLEAIATQDAKKALLLFADSMVDPADSLYARNAARRMKIRDPQ